MGKTAIAVSIWMQGGGTRGFKATTAKRWRRSTVANDRNHDSDSRLPSLFDLSTTPWLVRKGSFSVGRAIAPEQLFLAVYPQVKAFRPASGCFLLGAP